MRILLTLAAVLALAGCGAGSDESAATAPETVTVTETETVTTPTTTESSGADCSAAGLELTLPEQELPPAVADVRRRVFAAATACDYDMLEEIALEQGEGFAFTYGGESDASDYWRGEEQKADEPKPLQALATILTLPVTRNETGSYAWPSAYSESPSDADWQALVDAGLYPQEQIDLATSQGTGYLGYRTAITADGDWQFFIAGD